MYMLKNMSYTVYEYINKEWNRWFVSSDNSDFAVKEVVVPDENV